MMLKMKPLKFVVLICVSVAFLIMLILPFTFQKSEIKEEEKTTVVRVEPKKVEEPLHSVQLPDFGSIRDVKKKKRMFFDFIRPVVKAENNAILKQREFVLSVQDKLMLEEPLTAEEQTKLNMLVKKYRVSDKATPFQQVSKLLMRVDVIPDSLVLVQAANESAWGTSRFARIGLNFFGIWCYSKGCGMVPGARNEGANHEVKAFQSVQGAVSHYLHNINTNNAYAVFRTIRTQLREQHQPLTAQILATGLLPYSERGSDYVIEITDMLRHNRKYLAD